MDCLIRRMDWTGTVNDYIGSIEESLKDEYEMQDATPLPYLPNQNRLPSEERGEPTCMAEWNARLDAIEAEMRALAPEVPDTSHLSLQDACDLFAHAIYCGIHTDQVPQRVRDEWARQYREEWSPEKYPVSHQPSRSRD